MQEVTQQFVNALALGSIYALVALGLGIVFSILGLVNFAYGELLTLAGFTLYLVSDLNVPWAFVVLAALITPILGSLFFERLVFRPMRGAPATALLLASFALSLILQNLFVAVFGAKAKAIPYPEWVGSSFELFGVRLAWLDIATFALTIAAMVALTLFLRRTTLGIALRAAAEDIDTTRMMGIRANRVVLTAFVISGFLAGLAGILWLASSGSVVATSGTVPLVKGFIAAVVGGLGSLVGASVAGFLIGGLEVLLRNVLPNSMAGLTDAVVFTILIAVLLLRPNGLFSKKERSA